MKEKLTTEELSIIEIALRRLEPVDLEIDCKYDRGDRMAVQMRNLPSEEMFKQLEIINNAIAEADHQKWEVLIPIMKKLGLDTNDYE